ncbi:hypothetical protein CHUAL_008697 [Chamberlinius hualienensis]
MLTTLVTNERRLLFLLTLGKVAVKVVDGVAAAASGLPPNTMSLPKNCGCCCACLKARKLTTSVTKHPVKIVA